MFAYCVAALSATFPESAPAPANAPAAPVATCIQFPVLTPSATFQAPDAIRSADNNLPLNAGLDAVSFERRDLAVDPLPVADVVTANLTGALLCRTAGRLVDAVRPGGHVIVSGILSDERDAVLAACAALDLVWERREDEWVGMCFDRPNQDRV